MVDFNNSLFNVVQAGQRIATRVLGSSLTGIIADLAKGLRNDGTVDINAVDPGTSTVIVRNSTSGQVADLAVSGSVAANESLFMANGTAFLNQFSSAVSAARNWVFPDKSGDVLVRASDTVVGLDGDTLFDANAVSDSSVGFFNSTVGRVCNLVAQGTMQFLSDPGTGVGFRFAGTPTALRTITFPDASGTVSLGGSSSIPSATNAAIHALTPTSPVIYYCTDIPGLSVGVVGALVYYNTLTPGWMRVSNDAFF